VHHLLRRTVAATTVAAALVVGLDADPAHAEAYDAPVPGEIVDDWRPPASAHGRGNRGVDLAAAPGDPVRAAAGGIVTFAGRVGPAHHVVVLHDDGLRTSYSFLAVVEVGRGDRVAQGDVVGRAGGAVHFGVRAGDTYLDPLLVLADDGPPTVHLVPERDRTMASEAEERRGLLRQLGAVVGTMGSAVGAAGGAVLQLATTHGWDVVRGQLLEAWAKVDAVTNGVRNLAHALNVPQQQRAWDRRRERVEEDQAGCTPAAVATPSRPAAGRVVLLVSGLASSTGAGSVLDVDTASLGYDATYELSYTAFGERYGRRDTYGDIGAAGRRLRDQLVEIGRRHPGVTVDVIGHSQGGLVARAGLSGADTFAPDLPVVGDVITLGTPHHGSELATAGAIAQVHPRVRSWVDLIDHTTRGHTPIRAVSSGQMSGGSAFIHELGRRSLPAGTRLTSIAASGDLIVDDEMSAVDDATNVIVPLEGVAAHGRLPGSDEAHREMALALAGLGPQCRGGGDLDAALDVADAIAVANATPAVADRIRASLGRLPGPDDL
jgi:hypothetical protein